MQRQVSLLVDSFKLSDSRWISHVYRPMITRELPPITEVHCGWSHTTAISGIYAVTSKALGL